MARDVEQAQSPRSRRLAFGLITLGVMTLVMLAFSEIVVRVLAPQPPSWLEIYRRHPTLPLYALQPNAERSASTGETRWTVITDENGYRVGARATAPSTKPTALVLGDSFTFAHGVDYARGFVSLLEETTELRYLNAAVPGYGPVQYRQILEVELARGLRPRLLLIGIFLGNDLQDCIWPKDLPVRDGVVGDEGGFKSALKRRSHLYRLVANLFHAAAAQGGERNDTPMRTFEPAQWQEGGGFAAVPAILERELGRIAELGKQHGFATVVLLIPSRQAVEAAQGGPRVDGLDYQLPARLTRDKLDAAGLPYVDVLDALRATPAEQIYFTFDGHLTALGNRLVADALRPRVQALLSPPHPP